MLFAKRVGLSVLPGIACIATTSCLPGGEPLGNLTFWSQHGDGTSSLLVAKQTNPLTPNNAWGPAALGPTLTNTSLDPAEPLASMFIQYVTIPQPTQALRQEVDFFARDPAEYTNTITGLLNDAETWQSTTGPCSLPDVLRLRYPFLSAPGTPAQWGPPTQSSTFFPNCAQGSLDPNVSAPMGYGSIRAAYVNDRGVCAASVDASSVLSTLQASLFGAFGNAVASTGCADAEQQWFFASEYLTENGGDPDILPKGGFDINFYFDANIHLPLIHNSNARANYQYSWGLVDGILSVDAAQNGIDVNGFSASDVQSSLVTAMSSTVPTILTTAAAAQQVVDLFPNLTLQGNCTPGTDSSVPIGDQGVGLELALLTVALENANNDGTLAQAGAPDVPNQAGLRPVTILENTMAEPDPVNPKNYHNWQCVNGLSSTTYSKSQYRYVYVPRAKRLNFYPDSVELVWLDDLSTEIGSATNLKTTGSALPIYVLLQEKINQAMTPADLMQARTLLGQLCGSPIGRPTRSFAVVAPGYQINLSSNASDCTESVLGKAFTNVFFDTAVVAGSVTFNLFAFCSECF